MKDKLLLIRKHLKQGTLRKMWAQSKWILQYGRRYWKAMVLYTLLGIAGSGVSLISSLISKDLVDIITGHQTGKLLATFAAMIGFSLANILVSQASGYASTFINLKVDSKIKNDIFAKMLVTDWESLTAYHTGDLVTRWSSDASNISSGILNWIPNLIIYTFRFVSALAVVLYYDPTFALFALLGIPFSALLSRPLLRRMRNNNQKSAAMNAKMYGFNQEAFSNIQTIKAFDLIRFYTDRLKSLQTEYIRMRLDFQKMSILTSVLMSIIGFIVSYSCYGWGIYRVWSNAISYGTMTMFLSLSGTLTSSVNSLTSLIPTAISLTISAGRLMDIVEMPQEDYSQDSAVEKFGKQHRQEGIGLIMKDLDYTYRTGTNVFSGASMEAYPHEIVALVGPSGEGKTTMLRLILSLLKPQKGSFHICAGHNEKEQLAMSPSTRSKRGLPRRPLFPIHFASIKYASTAIPRIIRYQPNTLKSCFLTKLIKKRMMSSEDTNAVIVPMPRIISSVDVNAKPNLRILSRLAPNMTGMARKNVNSAATVRDTPSSSAPTMVAPEREVPGNTAAISWNIPIINTVG